jgi:gliding motility-associated protein GldL
MEVQRKFDYVNFFYGVGAAIILIAALFKFLGWKFADLLFMIGLIGEAIIFLISAFDYKLAQPNYQWDKLFPQLKEKKEVDDTTDELGLEELEATAEMTKEHQLQKILDSINTLDNNLQALNEATKKLNSTVDLLEKNYEGMSQTTLEYQQQVNSLKIKITAANEKLKEFENYKY